MPVVSSHARREPELPCDDAFRLVPALSDEKAITSKAKSYEVSAVDSFREVSTAALEYVGGIRKLCEREDAGFLWEAFSDTCRRFLESDVDRLVRREIKVFVELQREKTRRFELEVKLATAALECMTKIMIAQVQAEVIANARSS